MRPSCTTNLIFTVFHLTSIGIASAIPNNKHKCIMKYTKFCFVLLIVMHFIGPLTYDVNVVFGLCCLRILVGSNMLVNAWLGAFDHTFLK